MMSVIDSNILTAFKSPPQLPQQHRQQQTQHPHNGRNMTKSNPMTKQMPKPIAKLTSYKEENSKIISKRRKDITMIRYFQKKNVNTIKDLPKIF